MPHEPTPEQLAALTAAGYRRVTCLGNPFWTLHGRMCDLDEALAQLQAPQRCPLPPPPRQRGSGGSPIGVPNGSPPSVSQADLDLAADLDRAIAAGQELPAPLPPPAPPPKPVRAPEQPATLFEEESPAMMIDVSCSRCGKRYGFHGRVLDQPPCPRCGHAPPLEGLKADAAIIEQARKDMRISGFNSREKCKSCGAEILFVVTTNGKLMPLDAQPVAGGNVVLDPALDRARVLKKDEAWEGDRYVAHFASCPNGSVHRRKKGGGA